jgi:hypothetical protein
VGRVAELGSFGVYFDVMKKRLHISIVTALLASGCANAPTHPSALSLCYDNKEFGLVVFLPAAWQGYSVLIQQWDSETGHGPMITLRHPQWKASAPYQDIPILVFTRAQWDFLHQGKLWPSLYAGGVMNVLWHNQTSVFGISSRYNATDDVKGWNEVVEIVERNHAAHGMPPLYPE